jgi:hypothetical protein
MINGRDGSGGDAPVFARDESRGSDGLPDEIKSSIEMVPARRASLQPDC